MTWCKCHCPKLFYEKVGLSRSCGQRPHPTCWHGAFGWEGLYIPFSDNVCITVYLVGYIFCIIDYHICRDIFGRIDIMYCRLSYVSRCALLLKILVLYIYRPRVTMQYNQQLYALYSSYIRKLPSLAANYSIPEASESTGCLWIKAEILFSFSSGSIEHAL